MIKHHAYEAERNFAQLAVVFTIVDIDISRIPLEPFDGLKADAMFLFVESVLRLVPIVLHRGP